MHRWQSFWWLSTFGRVQTQVPYLRCGKGHHCHRPFQTLTGLKCRGKSLALQRALSDFGAEKSFAQASKQLWEHYGVAVHPSSVRQVVERQAQRAEAFVAGRHEEAIHQESQRQRRLEGKPWLIVESDGSFVRTGEWQRDPAGGLSPKGQRAKQRRQTQWREVRLSTVQVPGEEARQYGAVLGSPTQVGQQMLALALLAGYGDNTQVHGVGDGAHWIAQQMAEVFPKHRYLLDRYHLLEHLYGGAGGLANGSRESAREWVQQQVSHIDQGGVGEVLATCREGGGADPEHPLNQLAGYLEHQQGHLDYARARAQGLPIGSGAVEGGHRHVIQARLKLPGTWWKEEMLNPMLALRTLRVNGWWHAFWN